MPLMLIIPQFFFCKIKSRADKGRLVNKVNLDFQDGFEKAPYKKLFMGFGDCRGRRKAEA